MKNRYAWAGVLLVLGGTAAGAAFLNGEGEASVPPYRFRVSRPADPDAEISFLEARVKRDPEGALDRAALAAAYASKAKRTGHDAGYGLAERVARESLARLSRGNEGATLVLARVAESRHEFGESLRLAAEVLRERPGHPEAMALQVTSNLGRGRTDEASRAADLLMERRPTLLAFTLRALSRAATGRDEEALHDFIRGIRLEDVGEADLSAWARTLLARFHLQRGRLKAAQRLLGEALRIRSGHPLALHLLGEVYEKRGDAREAERAYGWAAADGHDPAPLASLARLKRSEPLFREAEERMREQGHRGALARLLLERGRAAEALPLAREEARARRNVETLDTLAWALTECGRPEEAYRTVQEALRTGVRDRNLYTRAALISERLGRVDQAILYNTLILK